MILKSDVSVMIVFDQSLICTFTSIYYNRRAYNKQNYKLSSILYAISCKGLDLVQFLRKTFLKGKETLTSMTDSRISGADEPRAISVRLDTVSFQMRTVATDVSPLGRVMVTSFSCSTKITYWCFSTVAVR